MATRRDNDSKTSSRFRAAAGWLLSQARWICCGPPTTCFSLKHEGVNHSWGRYSEGAIPLSGAWQPCHAQKGISHLGWTSRGPEGFHLPLQHRSPAGTVRESHLAKSLPFVAPWFLCLPQAEVLWSKVSGSWEQLNGWGYTGDKPRSSKLQATMSAAWWATDPQPLCCP